MSDDTEIPSCPECGQKFDNVFDATEHLMEDGDEFDPALILPGGFKLMIGSLLKFMYFNADDEDIIKKIAQSTYMTLFAAEVEADTLAGMVEDMVVSTTMMDLDDELKKLLKSGE
jgi:uncharacterized protein (UPF0212 family)